MTLRQRFRFGNLAFEDLGRLHYIEKDVGIGHGLVYEKIGVGWGSEGVYIDESTVAIFRRFLRIHRPLDWLPLAFVGEN